jgi:hypothetical protein
VYNSLSPLLTDGASSPASPEDRKRATGMVVYNTNPNADGILEGFNVWNGKEWAPMQGNIDKPAKIRNIDCSQIRVEGSYAKNEALRPSIHTLTIPVFVEREGSYKITVIAQRADTGANNGYSFTASGKFNSVGFTSVTLTGQGMPIESSKHTGRNDELVMSINDANYLSCTSTMPTVYVEDISPNFYIDCSSVNASQVTFRIGEPAQGYIRLSVIAPINASGAEYVIETNTIDGIKFSAKGTLVGGTQPITLMSNGASPTKAGDIFFSLTSNSSNPKATPCSVGTRVKGKALNIRIYCSADGDWDLWSTNNNIGGIRRIFENASIRESFLAEDINVVRIPTNIQRLSANKNTLIDDADIIIIAYGSGNIDDARASVFRDFVYDDKGVVILCYESQGSSIINRMFNSMSVSLQNLNGRYYRLNEKNSIINGEYADLTNQYVGLDGGGNELFIINDSPAGVEELMTINGLPFIAKPKDKNFIVIGDGGFFMGGTRTFTAGSKTYRPLQVSAGGQPEIRNKNGEYDVDTYNAHFFLNIMHWAIRQRLEGK